MENPIPLFQSSETTMESRCRSGTVFRRPGARHVESVYWGPAESEEHWHVTKTELVEPSLRGMPRSFDHADRAGGTTSTSNPCFHSGIPSADAA